jgi:hypothetical protein
MSLDQIARKLNLKPKNEADAGAEVTSGYASDLLSDVLAKARKGTLWVTNQKHQNVIGVAVMLDLAGVVIAGGMEPDDNTLEKARDENVSVYTTTESLFDVVGKLYEMGVRSS